MLLQAIEVDYDYNNIRSFGGRRRAAVLQRHQRRSRQGDLRPEDQAASCRRQYPHDGCRRQGHLCQHARSLRRLSRRLCRFAARRHRGRRRAWRRRAPTARSGNFTVFENGVYTACAACRTIRRSRRCGRSRAPASSTTRARSCCTSRTAQLEFFGVPLAYMPVLLDARSDGEAQDRLPDAGLHDERRPTASASTSPITGRSRRTMTRPSRRASRPGRACCCRPNSASACRMAPIRSAPMASTSSTRPLSPASPATASSAAPSRPRASCHRTSNGSGAGTAWWCATTTSVRITASAVPDLLQLVPNLPTEAISQLYLTGVGNRSFFDARTIYYYGLSASDNQNEIPVIHPVIDYSNVINWNLLGGELSYKSNFTNLTRQSASFDPITTSPSLNGWCMPTSADPTVRTPAQLSVARRARHLHPPLRRGRLAALLHRSVRPDLDAIRVLRADAHQRRHRQPARRLQLPDGRRHPGARHRDADGRPRIPISVHQRAAVGLDRRSTPIAQIIVRPNETYAGKLPNEDAQSLVLRREQPVPRQQVLGWDRDEGGGRANVGVQSTMQFDRGGNIKVLFGQSYQLFGLNSFAVRTPPTPASTPACRADNPTMSTASTTRRTRPIGSACARGSTSRPRTCSASRWRPAPTSIAGPSACCTAITPPSPISAT